MERSRFQRVIDMLKPLLIGMLLAFSWQTYQNTKSLKVVEDQIRDNSAILLKNQQELAAIQLGVDHQSRALDRIVELLSQK